MKLDLAASVLLGAASSAVAKRTTAAADNNNLILMEEATSRRRLHKSKQQRRAAKRTLSSSNNISSFEEAVVIPSALDAGDKKAKLRETIRSSGFQFGGRLRQQASSKEDTNLEKKDLTRCDPDLGILACEGEPGMSCQSLSSSSLSDMDHGEAQNEFFCMPEDEAISSSSSRKLERYYSYFCDYDDTTETGTKCDIYGPYCGTQYGLPDGYCYELLYYGVYDNGAPVEYAKCYIFEPEYGDGYVYYELCNKSVGTDSTQCVAYLDGEECNSCEVTVITPGVGDEYGEYCYNMDCSNLCVGGALDTCTSTFDFEPVLECFPGYKYCNYEPGFDYDNGGTGTEICDYPAICESDEGETIPVGTFPNAGEGYCVQNIYSAEIKDGNTTSYVDTYTFFPEGDNQDTIEFSVEFSYTTSECTAKLDGVTCNACTADVNNVGYTCVNLDCTNTCAASNISTCGFNDGFIQEPMFKCFEDDDGGNDDGDDDGNGSRGDGASSFDPWNQAVWVSTAAIGVGFAVSNLLSL